MMKKRINYTTTPAYTQSIHTTLKSQRAHTSMELLVQVAQGQQTDALRFAQFYPLSVESDARRFNRHVVCQFNLIKLKTILL